jgi:hypothetical protein
MGYRHPGVRRDCHLEQIEAAPCVILVVQETQFEAPEADGLHPEIPLVPRHDGGSARLTGALAQPL